MRSFLLLQSDYGIVMRRHSQTLPQQARSLHIEVPRIFTRWEVALVTNTYITVQCAGSASGERLPPFILYKGTNLYQRWTEGGPAGVLYGVSESGWMDSSNVLSRFKNLFLRAVAHL